MDPGVIAQLAPVTLVVGKGGVGKTTLAASLARHFADEHHRTLVVTTDPAATLLVALGRPIERSRRPLLVLDRLDAWALDTEGLRDEFLARWRDPIATILDRGTYLDDEDIDGLVDAALPGADEIFAVLALGDVLARGEYARVVIDTAPTGHTLRLLTLPQSFRALVRLLDAMQEKHRFIVRALTHRYRGDAADALIAELGERVEVLQGILTDPARCRAVLVTRDEPVVQAETERYRAALQLAGIAVATVYTVRPTDGALDSARASTAPTDDTPPNNMPASNTPVGSAPRPATGSRHADALALREMTVVGGKGGVGKTTVSCALAIRSADAGSRTLLVSTDPAPSIADALRVEIGDEPTDILEHLVARQVDATSAFAAFRESYRERIDELFAGIAGRGIDVAHDRGIVRDLFSLAPPGIDELYALTVLGEELEGGRFDRIIIDPAPTGHLLRLLDMPRLAVAWAHQLMRLMLKYREIVALGDSAAELLAFARRTKALEQQLHDPARAAVVLVSLDEPLVRDETSRLAGELGDRDIAIAGVVWNRALARTQPLPAAGAIPQLFAPPASPPPVGVDAIRAWHDRWGVLAAGLAR